MSRESCFRFVYVCLFCQLPTNNYQLNCVEGKMQSNDDFRKDDLKDLKGKAEKDLFEAIGFKDLSDEEKAALLGKMMRLIEVRTLNKILDSLTPEQDEKLKNLDQENPDALEAFLQEDVPDYESLFYDEAKKLQQELLIEHGQN